MSPTRPMTFEDTPRSEMKVGHRWLKDLCCSSTIHGLAWYNRSQSHCVKVLILLFIVFLIVGLPIFIIIKTFTFWNSEEVFTTNTLERMSSMVYPNITVCFAGLFDKERMKNYSVSNDMANYISIALDPGTSGYQIDAVRSQMTSLIERLDQELDVLLDSLNMTMVDLMDKIAVRCSDFIRFCEIHKVGQIGMTPEGLPESLCCGKFFNPQPIFTNMGTCFTSHLQVLETEPYVYSSIKIWLNSLSGRSPTYKMVFRSGDAITKNDVIFAISHMDHPLSRLMQSPFKASRSTHTMVALSVKKMDLSSLAGSMCRVKNPNFNWRFVGVPYTMLNCENLPKQFIPESNCSLLPYIRVKSADPIGSIACKPRDLLRIEPNSGSRPMKCLGDCHKIEYEARISQGMVSTAPLKEFFSLLVNSSLASEEDNIDNSFETDTVILDFYFESLVMPTIIMKQSNFSDFLSQIGGWLGLAMGASIISFVELLFFTAMIPYRLITSRSETRHSR